MTVSSADAGEARARPFDDTSVELSLGRAANRMSRGGGNRIQEALLEHMANRSDTVFCHQVSDQGETTITWKALRESCGAFGQAYERVGLHPGDQVLIFLRHIPQLYGAYFGAMLIGATPSFMPCSSPRQDPDIYWRSHEALLARIRPPAIVTDAYTLREMQAAGMPLEGTAVLLIEDLTPAPLKPRAVGEDAIALLQHSSGTTGLKKGVALNYSAIADQLESYAAAIALDASDVIVSWLPLYHDMGLIACLMLPAYYGVPVTHLDPFYWVARPGTLFDHIAERRGTLCWLPNFAFDHLAGTVARRAATWDLSHVKAFINCSEPCKCATFDRFADAFAPSGICGGQLQCCYAMAETVFAVSQSSVGAAPARRIRVHPASLQRGNSPEVNGAEEGVELLEAGTAIKGLAVSIHDESGAEIDPGLIGEIAVRGDFLFSGYNHDSERTAERIRDGAYFTRDLGFVHEGRLYVLGRLDDLIIINGRNLYAHEIEATIVSVAGLKPGRSAAMAWFDARVGSETLVLMAERARASKRSDEEVKHDISHRIFSVFNVMPRAIELVDEGVMVKTSSGKVSRKENLDRFIAARSLKEM